MSKTKTETQDLQDQYWKSMTGMDRDILSMVSICARAFFFAENMTYKIRYQAVSLSLQFKTSSGNNSGSTEDKAVKFGCSMGF